MLDIPDIFGGEHAVDAGSKPTYEEKMREPTKAFGAPQTIPQSQDKDKYKELN